MFQCLHVRVRVFACVQENFSSLLTSQVSFLSRPIPGVRIIHLPLESVCVVCMHTENNSWLGCIPPQALRLAPSLLSLGKEVHL